MAVETLTVVELDNSLQSEMKDESSKLVVAAKAMTIQSHEDYESAGKFLVQLKTQMKKVKDYWAKPKADAEAAHKTLCAREKEMLAPFADAEKIVKTSMAQYQAAVEAERRKAAEEAEKRKREEAERLLNEAIKAEQSGNAGEAAATMAMAEIVDDMKPVQTVEAPKAANTYVRKTWKARVADPAKVPAYVNGMEVRQINLTALNSLAKMSNGTMQVPGVEFYQEQSISIRA